LIVLVFDARIRDPGGEKLGSAPCDRKIPVIVAANKIKGVEGNEITRRAGR